jgi:hypothetical protein
MIWSSLFTASFPVEGASEDELRTLVAALSKPLSEEEISAVNALQSNAFLASDPLHRHCAAADARDWRIPTNPLPPAYLDILRWSNGGSFWSGDRRFDPFFSASEIRPYLVGYQMPQFMPDAIPFAFDGGGNFYLFDMRRPSIGGEYPILFVGSGNLGYNDAVLVATSFVEACRGSSDPSQVYLHKRA